jgi:hypothetical protein
MMEGIGYEVTKFDEFKGEFERGVRHGKGVLKEKGVNSIRCYYQAGSMVNNKIPEDVSEIESTFSA